MRIKSIELEWFRGAADKAQLALGAKSIVVYGINGSGKSSFVDAIEYAITDGRIKHLANEYSGRRLEKAVINTHKPDDRSTSLSIVFNDGSEFKEKIQKDGSHINSGLGTDSIRAWDYQRTVLRQDELARFITDRKGEKYSALLPLLGLEHLENLAENLRQLGKAIETTSRVSEIKYSLRSIDSKRIACFGKDADDAIQEKMIALHKNYCPESKETILSSKYIELDAAIKARIAASTSEQQQYIALKDIAASQLKEQIAEVREVNAKLAGAIEPLIAEKLEVLQATEKFIAKSEAGTDTACPACGRSISVDSFKEHIQSEQIRLREIISTFNSRRIAMSSISNTIHALKQQFKKSELAKWKTELLTKEGYKEKFDYLSSLNSETLRTSCTEAELKGLESKLLPLIEEAKQASSSAPPDAQELSTHKQMIEVATEITNAAEKSQQIEKIETLVAFIQFLEKLIREGIRKKSQSGIDDISSDIKEMWEMLHPGTAIENVRLSVPEESDKAIDIALRFYGVEQDSPRLTLSEGYRNSLGLCIFLAMAKRESGKDRPVFLDDVVVSLDRQHRGMIKEVIEKHLANRQVVILTHDREWYAELRQQLDEKDWKFQVLLPYETPNVGIRWAHKTTTFDDARAHLVDRPDSAGNDARKIMDVELAITAEQLQIRMPYLRGEKNERRMANDFLERLIADGKKCFEIKNGGHYEPYAEAITELETAKKLLGSWGNKASHSFDMIRPEAEKLINACESAYNRFKCASCGKQVWKAEDSGSGLVQCTCSGIRWRYGKA